VIISGANSSALLVLRQTSSVNFAQNALQTNKVAGSTNGAAPADQITKILANAPGASVQDEVKLFQKVGQVLGVDETTYASATDYANALKQAVGNLKLAAGQSWSLVEKGLEHQMGLDKLGVSLDTVINAIAGDGGSQDAVRKALEKQESTASASSGVSTNDVGTYSPASALQ